MLLRGYTLRVAPSLTALINFYRSFIKKAMPTIASTPKDTADMFRRFRNVPGLTDNDKLVRSAPLPTGCRISFRSRLNKSLDQDRLHLSRSDAQKYQRVWGVVVSIKPEKANTPANTMAVFKFLTTIYE